MLHLINRHEGLFDEDLKIYETRLLEIIQNSKFLVIGGAGSIGQAVVKEIFKRNPKSLHVVDISENNMVELVRDIRSTVGYGSGDFRTFAIDCGSQEFELLVRSEGPYDYILNLSALKHVRSEKNSYTLMRMIDVNIMNTVKTIRYARNMGSKKYFCVSTDKAANPVNLMGASKRVMEMFMVRESVNQNLSMARFANVAFSDGSLLHGFNQRFLKKQPIAAPKDVLRYFLTAQESGELCLISALIGENREILFPKLSEKIHLISFSQIAVNYLRDLGYEPYECSSEQEAREKCVELIVTKKWPCYFFESDTTGEKGYEEFFTAKESVDLSKYKNIGVINNNVSFDAEALDFFVDSYNSLRLGHSLQKKNIVELFHNLIPEFTHDEKGKYLDDKM